MGQHTPSQMLAHCSESLRMALGDFRPPRKFLGRMIGFVIKPFIFGNDKPMRMNSPTVVGLEVRNERNLDTERDRLNKLIDRFSTLKQTS